MHRDGKKPRLVSARRVLVTKAERGSVEVLDERTASGVRCGAIFE